ncbi:MAG: molybdate ABC transporter substrate-binding protein [Clostridia bacterium]|nr:molybdate ABC transporter substrate-binding protein [Clostridia bacterium]
MKKCYKTALLILLCISLMLFAGCGFEKGQKQALTVAAAADLQPAFQEIGGLFTKKTGYQVLFNFGSSGMLARQIANGAPVDVFASANAGYVDELIKQGQALEESRMIYARGRIVLVQRDDSLRVDRLEDLRKPNIKSIAIANPGHAPYGAAAKEAMMKAGVWRELQPKLIYGENVRDSFRYVESGNVDVAIIALSLARQSGIKYVEVDESLYPPLEQVMAVVAATKEQEAARRFVDYVNGTEGRQVMKKYGFYLPGEY